MPGILPGPDLFYRNYNMITCEGRLATAFLDSADNMAPLLVQTFGLSLAY